MAFKEYERVISNPENFIVSDELQGILEDSPDDSNISKSNEGILQFDDSKHIFIFEKIRKIGEMTFLFKGEAPTFPMKEFFEGKDFSLLFCENTFVLQRESPVSLKSDRTLTFTARRIINNEEVSV